MEIHVTEQASEQIRKQPGIDTARLTLVYDTEGCGCAVNGVPALWIVPGKDPAEGELAAAGEPVPLHYRRLQEVFFEDRMTLDYRADRQSFILKSSSQIYHAGMSLIDKR